MTDRKSLDDFIQDLQQLIGGADASIKPKIRALANSFLAKQNIVTREEFDAQATVLLRTREKIDALEKQLEQLQQAIDKPN